MSGKDINKKCIGSLLSAGADKAQCSLTKSSKHEMSIEFGKVSLNRTIVNDSLNMIALKDGRKGSVSINTTESEAIESAVYEAILAAESSEQDSANDIAPLQLAKKFIAGPQAPDLDKMYQLLEKFEADCRKKYPKTILGNVFLDFVHSVNYFANSNGVDFETNKGVYNFFAQFTSKDGGKMSSFNYCGYSIKELGDDLLKHGPIDTMLKQSSEHIHARPLEGKFVGDIIVAPECFRNFIRHSIVNIAMTDESLISGTSMYKDKLGQKVADTRFNLYSRPVSDEIAERYFVTDDGFETQNCTLIDKGILKSFLLSQYGANKTGREKAVNGGGAYIVDPGDTSFEDMVKSIDKGMLVCRFAGGLPSSNGDFSGIAANSYYIENGKIQYPVSEASISGNFAELLLNIKDISKERVDFGGSIFPWISATNIAICGR